MADASGVRDTDAPAVKTLKVALKKKGWSSGDLARELKTNSGTVSRWMTGTRTPSFAMAHALESLLGVPATLWLKSA